MDRTFLEDEESTKITEKDLPQEFILKLLGRYEAKGLWGIKNTREPVDLMVRYAKSHELSLPIVQVVVTKEGIFMSPVQCRLDNRSRDNIKIKKTNSKCQPVVTKIPVTETWNDDGVVKPCNIAQAVLKQMKDCDSSKADEKFGCFIHRKPQERKIEPPTDLQLLEKYSRIDWRKRGIFFFGIDTISYGVQDLIYTRVFSMIVVSDRNTKPIGKTPFMCHAFVCESRSTARRVTHSLAAAFQAYGRSMKRFHEIEKPVKKSCQEKPKKFIIELRPSIEVAHNDSEA